MLVKHFLPSVVFLYIPVSIFLFPSAASGQQESVYLAWSPNIEPDLSHYNLYRDTQPGTMVHLAAITKPDTTYTDTQTAQGNTYYYKLTAVDIHGYESGPSNEVSIAVVNDPPTVSQIPNQTIAEGGSFSSIQLDNYVSDPDHSDSQLTWSYSGNSQLSVSIDANRVATINIPNQNWYGSETITFKATDPGGLSASRSVTFTVSAVADPPIISQIPNQTIEEGQSFQPIKLDDCVSDVDNPDDQLSWSCSGNSQLNVSIDNNRVATIIIPNSDWYGSETITFQVTDPTSLSNSSQATFTVGAVNDAPYLKKSLADISQPEDFDTAIIADLNDVFGDVEGDPLTFQAISSGNNVLPTLDNSILSISSTLNYYGKDTITVTATDNISQSQAQDVFMVTVTPVNDSPQIVNLPSTLTISGDGIETLSMKEHVQDVDSPLDAMQWTFSATHDSLKWQFDPTTSRLTIWAGYYQGNVELTCTVTDDQQASNNAIVTIQIDNQLTAIDNLLNLVPEQFHLEQNYPNPFNPSTTIRFHLPVSSHVTIEIYNITGQLMTTLMSDHKPAGIHEVEFDAARLPSGIYFYHLQTGEFSQIRRMILTK